MKFWIVIYSHKHGVDVWPKYQDIIPTEKEMIADLAEGTFEDREDEVIEASGPFYTPEVK